jgi:hypothetical protein
MLGSQNRLSPSNHGNAVTDMTAMVSLDPFSFPNFKKTFTVNSSYPRRIRGKRSNPLTK